MVGRKSRKLASVTVNLPVALIEALDQLAEETETTRTDVMKGLLDYGLNNVDEVFPLEEGETETEEDQNTEDIAYDPKKAGRTQRISGGWY